MEKTNIDKNNINKYYDLINNLVDKYFKIHISPSALKNYFSNAINLDKFKTVNKLNNINKIDTVINDVLNDRISIISEKLILFADYKEIFSDISFMFSDTTTPTTTEESIIADYCMLPLSKIKISNNDRHLYNVSDKQMICLSESNINVILKNLNRYITKKIMSDRIEIPFMGLSFNLSEVIKEDDIYNILYANLNINTITTFMSFDSQIKYAEEYKGYHIWYVM